LELLHLWWSLGLFFFSLSTLQVFFYFTSASQIRVLYFFLSILLFLASLPLLLSKSPLLVPLNTPSHSPRPLLSLDTFVCLLCGLILSLAASQRLTGLIFLYIRTESILSVSGIGTLHLFYSLSVLCGRVANLVSSLLLSTSDLILLFYNLFVVLLSVLLFSFFPSHDVVLLVFCVFFGWHMSAVSPFVYTIPLSFGVSLDALRVGVIRNVSNFSIFLKILINISYGLWRESLHVSTVLLISGCMGIIVLLMVMKWTGCGGKEENAEIQNSDFGCGCAVEKELQVVMLEENISFDVFG